MDRLPELLDSPALAEVAADTGLPPELLRTLRAIPSYYLHYFYCTDEAVRAQASGPQRAEEVLEIERTLLAMYADPALDHKPALLEQRGGAYYSEAAAALVTSLLTGDGAHHYVDVRNDGTIAGLPDEAVVEVPALVDTAGPHPVPVDPLAAGDARPRPGGDRVRGAGDRGGPDRGPRHRAAGAAGQPAGAAVGPRGAAARRAAGGEPPAPAAVLRRDG